MKTNIPRRDLRSRIADLEAGSEGPAMFVLCLDGEPSLEQRRCIDAAKRRHTTVVILAKGDRHL